MKHLLFAAIFSFMSIPAFAEIASVVEDENIASEQSYDDSALDEQGFTVEEEQIENELSLPRPPGGWMFTCTARNIFGRQFRARGWNQGGAMNRALSNCRQMSLPFVSRTCRPSGCGRHWN